MTDGRGLVPGVIVVAGGGGMLAAAVRGLWSGRAPIVSRSAVTGEARGVFARALSLLYLLMGAAMVAVGGALLAGTFDAT